MAEYSPTLNISKLNLSLDTDSFIPLAETEPKVTAETNIPLGESFTQQQTTLWIVLYVIWIGLIISLNIATIMALIHAKVIAKKASNMFLLSLIVARTAIAVLVIPARITGLFSNEHLGSTLCKLCHLCGNGSSASSIFSTCGIAISKFLEIKHPDINISQKKGLFGVILVWVIGFLYGIRSFILNDLVLVNTLSEPLWACTADPSKHLENQVFIFVDLVVMFVIPLIIIFLCYCNVLKILKQNVNSKVFSLTDVSNGIYKQDFSEINKENENINNIKMLIGIMAAFIICYAAVYVWKLYLFFSRANNFTSHFLTIEQVVYLIAYSNPWINVFIYVIFRNDIRKNFCCGCRKLQSIGPVKHT